MISDSVRARTKGGESQYEFGYPVTGRRFDWWRIHMWLSAPFLAGVVGLGLSYLLVPPPLPAE